MNLHPSSLLVIVANLVWGVGALGALTCFRGNVSNRLFSTFLFVGSLLMGAGTVLGFPDQLSWQAAEPVYLGLAPLANRLDPLSSLFLLVLAVVGICVSFFSPQYLDHLSKRINLGFYWSCLFTFCIGMAQVLLSANAITFLVFWELMSLSSVALVASESTRKSAQRSAFIYLTATRISTAFITSGFIWMYFFCKSWNFADWSFAGPERCGAALVILIGLCIKAGVWPFHTWLPYAHPEAPAPVSALMSGVMVKVAIYGIVRFLVCNSCDSDIPAFCALGLGLISSIWGVICALMQRDLKRLLAFSTVENTGLLVGGIGLALLAHTRSYEPIAILAMTAVLFHVINHGVFKSLLFLSAGTIDAQAHTRDLSLLGGLAKGMPATMICFLVGSIAICAMPPFNGFISKYLFYQSFFQLSWTAVPILEKAGALVIVALLSCVGALSLACFAKAVGIAFLGRARSDLAAATKEPKGGMIVAQMILATLCAAIGMFGPFVLVYIQPVVGLTLHERVDLSRAFNLPMLPLFLIGISLSLVFYRLFLAPANHISRKFITWDCGFGDLPSRAEETGSSFSQPIGSLFAPLLQYRMSTEIAGKDRRHFPDMINFQASMTSFLEQEIYRRTGAALEGLSTLLVRLQTGSIHVHLLYVFLSVIVVALVGSFF